jgi:hypothetical protein
MQDSEYASGCQNDLCVMLRAELAPPRSEYSPFHVFGCYVDRHNNVKERLETCQQHLFLDPKLGADDVAMKHEAAGGGNMRVLICCEPHTYELLIPKPDVEWISKHVYNPNWNTILSNLSSPEAQQRATFSIPSALAQISSPHASFRATKRTVNCFDVSSTIVAQCMSLHITSLACVAT